MLTVDEIHKIEKNRNEIRKEIYKKIYESFTKKIKNAVQLNQKNVLLKVPSFLIGYPAYDVNKASTYLIRQLNLGGFTVTCLSDTDLHVSWIKKKKKSTPKREHTHVDEFEDPHDIPSLVNLKKLASKHKRA
mgnify:FL=1